VNLSALDLVIRVSRATAGACEVPAGSNAGPYVERIQRLTGLKKGDPWCACEVRNVGYSALGPLWPVPAIGGCQYLSEWAAEHGILETLPAIGDIFLLWEKVGGTYRFAHTGFIIGQVTAAGWPTHEGNTSGGGSREGWLVAERTRLFKAEDRFVRWVNLLKNGDH